MKKLFLHVGLHKTGTTSIQNWLLGNHDELLQSKYYYPIPVLNGPGHAELSWDMCGTHERSQNWSGLHEIIKKASELNSDNIILSAEDFIYGFFNGSFENFPKKIWGGEIEIIITLSNLSTRYLSSVYESIKHNHSFDFNNFNHIAYIMSQPTLHPDFLQKILSVFNSEKIKIIFTSAGDPVDTYRKFSECIGLSRSLNVNDQLLNSRLSDAHVEILNFFNLKVDGKGDEKRKFCGEIIKMLDESNLDSKFEGLKLGCEVADFLSALWRAQIFLINTLESMNKVQVIS